MLKNGITIQNLNCNVIDKKKNMKELFDSDKNILIFSRFYGCRIAKYDLKDFADNYTKIIKHGGKVFFVLQSSKEIIKKAYLEENYPFTIICDPERILYKYFEVDIAENKEMLAGDIVNEKLIKAKKIGLIKGELEGEPLQLPAQFIINKDLKILFSHYGKNAGDILPPDSILKIVDKL